MITLMSNCDKNQMIFSEFLTKEFPRLFTTEEDLSAFIKGLSA